MQVTTEQIEAFIARITEAGTSQGQIFYTKAGSAEIILGNPYVIGDTDAGRLPHRGHANHYQQQTHFAFDLPRPVPPITDAEKWSEQTVTELTRAREVIIEFGWVQGALTTPDGVYTLGAIGKAAKQETAVLNHRARVLATVLEGFLREVEHTNPLAGIAAWNDDPKRTQDQVLDVLHRCVIWVKGKIDNG